MDLKRKRQNELDEMKSKRIAHILDKALDLFSEKGIDVIAMTDIAEASEIGVASLYRYFKTKEELAIQCARHHWEKLGGPIMKQLELEDYTTASGFYQISRIFNIFTDLFEENRTFFKFIYYFDAFVNRNNISQERLSSYDMTIGKTKDVICDALKKGFSDGTINEKWKKEGTEHLYFTVMHSLFSMAQKLSLSENMLEKNRDSNSQSQLELLSRIYLETFRS